MFFLSFQSSFAILNIDSLENELKTAKDTNRAKILYTIAKNEYNNQPDKCMKYAIESAEICKKFGIKRLEASSYSIIGVIHKNRGEFEKALEFQLKALPIAQSLGNKKLLASTLNDLGIIYKTLKQFHTAIEHYEKALKIIEELGYVYPSIMIINNIGTIYVEIDEEDKALEYYEKALELSETSGILYAKAICLNNIGELLAKQNQQKEALEYFLETYEIDKQTGDKMGGIYTLLNLGAVYSALNNHSNSVNYYKLALNDAIELNATMLQSQIYAGLSESYERMKDTKTALFYFKKFKALNDSVFTAEKSKQIAEMQTKYQTTETKKENEILENENKIKDLKLEKRKSTILVLILLSITIIGIAVFLYYRYKQKQKALLNQEIIKQNKLRLKAVVDAQESERKRIAKDLHDGLGQSLSGIKLNWQNFIGKQKTKIPESNDLAINISGELDKACKDVRTISHQMMPYELTESKLIDALNELLTRSLSHSKIEHRFEHFGINEKFADDIKIGIYRITQELINNVIKHSEAKNLNLQLYKNKETIVLIVEDNGIGFSIEEQKNKGIGLMNINSRVDAINGELNYETGLGSGTVVTIRIPWK